MSQKECLSTDVLPDTVQGDTRPDPDQASSCRKFRLGKEVSVTGWSSVERPSLAGRSQSCDDTQTRDNGLELQKLDVDGVACRFNKKLGKEWLSEAELQRPRNQWRACQQSLRGRVPLMASHASELSLASAQKLYTVSYSYCSSASKT